MNPFLPSRCAIFNSRQHQSKTNYLLLELKDIVQPELTGAKLPRIGGAEVLGRFVAGLGHDFDEIRIVAPVALDRLEATGAHGTSGLTH